MKTIFILFICLFTYVNISAQSIINTTGSKSGILVNGTGNFAGIGYENLSDKFLFNYKHIKQISIDRNGVTMTTDDVGFNVGAGINTRDSKANFLLKEKWQGGLDFDLTFFKTWTTQNDFTSHIDTNSIQIQQDFTSLMKNTVYLGVSGDWDRFNNFAINQVNTDTTLATINDPFKSSYTLTLGFISTNRCSADWSISYAFSSNFRYIINSNSNLTKTNLVNYKGQLFNSKDRSQLVELGDTESYYMGEPENEWSFIPRADLFISYSLGDDNPYVGLLASCSYITTNIRDIKNRICLAFGPTFSLPAMPDQVVFGIMNEYVQNFDGEYQYSLMFQLRYPIEFK